MYAATVRERSLTFCVSGMLWNRSLVMKDLETGTLWSQILGEAMRGELKGETLELLPSAITTWADWKAEHPDTTVLALSRTAREFIDDFQKEPGRFVLGVGRPGGGKLCFPFDALRDRGVINDQVAGESVAATFEPETTEAHCFSRKLEGWTLTFQTTDAPRRMRDGETGSVWDSKTGVCLEGELKGRELRDFPAIVSFRRAWLTFHPDSRVWREEEKRPGARGATSK